MAYLIGDYSFSDEKANGFDSTFPSSSFQIGLGKVSFGKLSSTDLTDWYQLNLDGPGNYTLFASTDAVNNYGPNNTWNSSRSGIKIEITDRDGFLLKDLSTATASINLDGSINFNYAGGYSHGDFFVKISNLAYASTDYVISLSNDVLKGLQIDGTAGNDYLIGTNGNDDIWGGSGRDTIIAGTGDDLIDGSSGLDTLVLSGKLDNYTMNGSLNKFVLKDIVGNDGTDTVTQVERLIFTDGAVALDIDGTAGQAYRLYQAAFARKPDMVGLGYWINDMDKGASLTSVAAAFFKSPEFQGIYGSNPSTGTLLNNLYQNVLHRAPDQAGFDYWANQLNKGFITPAGVLASFSDSPENQAQVLGQIKNGIDYQLWLS